MSQQDPDYNTTNVVDQSFGLVAYGENFAFPATSTLSTSRGYGTVYRLPETQINIFDVTKSVEVMVDATNFNKKLGIVKWAECSCWWRIREGCFAGKTSEWSSVISSKDIFYSNK